MLVMSFGGQCPYDSRNLNGICYCEVLLLLQMIAFYLLRIILGAACALCEFYFYGLALHVCAKRITLQYMCYSLIPRV